MDIEPNQLYLWILILFLDVKCVFSLFKIVIDLL